MHASNRGGDLSNLRTAPHTSCNTLHSRSGVGRSVLRGWSLDSGTATWISLVILGLIHGTNTEPVRPRGGSGLLALSKLRGIGPGTCELSTKYGWGSIHSIGTERTSEPAPARRDWGWLPSLFGPGLGLPGLGFGSAEFCSQAGECCGF